MFWSAHSGIIAASSVVLARYVAYFVPLGDLGIRAVAIGAILVLSFVNYLGVRQGSMLQTVVTISKVVAILLLLGMVVFLGSPAAHSAAAAAAPRRRPSANSSSPSPPPSSRSADGTWSPTPPAKPATRSAPSRAPC